MSKSNMISISSMDKIMKNIEDCVTIDFYGEELIIKKYLSFDEMVKFVNEVVDGCFDNERGIYMPEVKDFLCDINTVLYYSNVRLPDDIRHKYDILTKTKIIDAIIDKIDFSQYQTIARAIEDKIDSRLNANEQLFNNKIAVIMSSIETLSGNIKDAFGNIDQDDVKSMLSAIVNNQLDEGKLVDAYLAAKDKEIIDQDEKESEQNNG